MQLDKDSHCIYGHDGLTQGAKDIKSLRGKVLESYHRMKAWEIAARTKSINTFPTYSKKDWINQCR